MVDLGCGAGVPCTAALAEHHDVLGVDVSSAQLALARRLVPAARFEKQDMTALRLPAGSVGAVTAFYSVGHVPRQEHAALLLDELVTMREPEGPATFQWVLARSRAG